MPRFQSGVKKSRPSLFIVGGIVASLLLLAGCSAAPAPSKTSDDAGAPILKVRMLVQPGSNSQAPIYVAQDAGIFLKHGLDVEIIGNANAITPLLSNDVDVAFPSPSQALTADQEGHSVQIFMTVVDRVLQGVMVRKDVAAPSKTAKWQDQIKALKGKTIGVTTRGGAVDINLRYLITAAGMDPDKDVTIVPTGNAAGMQAAMEAKRVDGILSLQPITAQLVASKSGTVLLDLSKGEGPEVMKQPFITGVANASYIKSNPDVINRIVASIAEAQAFIQKPANLPKFSTIVKNRVYSTLTPELITQISDQLAGATSTVCFGTADLDKITKVLKDAGVLKAAIPASTAIYFGAQKEAGCPGK